LSNGYLLDAYFWDNYAARFKKDPQLSDLIDPVNSPIIVKYCGFPYLWKDLYSQNFVIPDITAIHTKQREFFVHDLNINVDIPDRQTKAFTKYVMEVMASEGPFATRMIGDETWTECIPAWDWSRQDYAIIPKPKPKQWRWFTEEEAIKLWDKYAVCLLRERKSGKINTGHFIIDSTSNIAVIMSTGPDAHRSNFLEDGEPRFEWKAPCYDQWELVGVCD
jgi:hypothetical protein